MTAPEDSNVPIDVVGMESQHPVFGNPTSGLKNGVSPREVGFFSKRISQKCHFCVKRIMVAGWYIGNKPMSRREGNRAEDSEGPRRVGSLSDNRGSPFSL